MVFSSDVFHLMHFVRQKCILVQTFLIEFQDKIFSYKLKLNLMKAKFMTENMISALHNALILLLLLLLLLLYVTVCQ